MIYLSSNLKYLRKTKGLTQEGLAVKINIKRSMVGAYEEGRAEPKLLTLQHFAHYFKVSLGQLVNVDLEKNENESVKSDVEGKSLRILSIPVDDQDNELISLVPVKAAAGYLNGYADPEYIEELPKFRLPVPELTNKSYRAFQIKGDSMEPIKSSSYILCEYVENWHNIKDGMSYVILTKDDGIVYKRVFNKIKDRGELILNSDNPEYDSYSIHIDVVMEVWKALGYISFELPDPDSEKLSLRQLSAEIMELKRDFMKIKKARS